MANPHVDQISQLLAKIQRLNDGIRDWDQAEHVIDILPSQLVTLWSDLQQLEKSCEEADRTLRQSGHHWYTNGLIERLSLEVALEAVDGLEEQIRRVRSQHNTSILSSDVVDLQDIRRVLLQCTCQLQCFIEILNCYAITDLTHQFLSESSIYGAHDSQSPIRAPMGQAHYHGTSPAPGMVKFAKHTKSLVVGKLKITTQFIFSSRRARRCDERCHCKCHETSGSQDPGPGGQDTPRLRRWWPKNNDSCTDTSCRRLEWRKRQLVVRQTTFIMREYAIAVIRRGSGMKLELKVRPIIPETSDAIRYCQIGDLELLKGLILSGKASPWDTGPDGWSLLHNSAYCSSIDVVKFLLECGADKDCAEVKARKPSHLAKFKALRHYATEQQKHISRMLQDEGDFKEDFELSPLLTAALGEYDMSDTDRPSLSELLEMANALLIAPHPIDWDHWKRMYHGRSPLFFEMISIFRSGIGKKRTPTAIFRELLEQPDTIQKWTPVLWAACTGRVDALRMLLQAGADPKYITPSGRNVFHHASESSSVETLNLLLSHGCHENGVDINLADDWLETPLHLATEQNTDLIKMYLRHGANVYARQGDGLVPLCYPRILRNPQRFDNLSCYLTARADECSEINSIDNTGRTPIFNYLDTPNCVKLLLDHGAEIDVVDDAGKTVLHYACRDNHADTLSMLLDRASVALTNVRDSDSFTPLFLAFERDSIDCARILLRRTRVLETVDNKGWTVLHHAAKSQDEECLNLALSIPETDITALTPEGFTAFDLLNAHQRSSRLVQDVYGGMSWDR